MFADGQLRTLQRKVKHWRATEGPGKETFFPQLHLPGDLCETDFTSMNKLGITIGGQRFYRLAFGYHDQGHSPLRAGVEVGERSALGMNYRMNELTGAVALA
jgi:hypothetical protein